jgi:2-oxoglutarate ferredoxin oxidoreductase subunit delta
MIDAATLPATAQPAESPPARRDKPRQGHVRLFGNWCKGCGLCIAFCPQQVFEVDSELRPVVAHPEACVACQWCVIHCPDFAILVEVEGSEARP